VFVDDNTQGQVKMAKICRPQTNPKEEVTELDLWEASKGLGIVHDSD